MLRRNKSKQRSRKRSSKRSHKRSRRKSHKKSHKRSRKKSHKLSHKRSRNRSRKDGMRIHSSGYDEVLEIVEGILTKVENGVITNERAFQHFENFDNLNEIKDTFTGANALMIACKYNNIEVIKYFLNKGININDLDENGGNALFYVNFIGEKNLETLILLLKENINIFNINTEGIDIFTHIQLLFGLDDNEEYTNSLLTCFRFLVNRFKHNYCSQNFIDDPDFVKNVALFLSWVPEPEIINKIVEFGNNNIKNLNSFKDSISAVNNRETSCIEIKENTFKYISESLYSKVGNFLIIKVKELYEVCGEIKKKNSSPELIDKKVNLCKVIIPILNKLIDKIEEKMTDLRIINQNIKNIVAETIADELIKEEESEKISAPVVKKLRLKKRTENREREFEEYKEEEHKGIIKYRGIINNIEITTGVIDAFINEKGLLADILESFEKAIKSHYMLDILLELHQKINYYAFLPYFLTIIGKINNIIDPNFYMVLQGGLNIKYFNKDYNTYDIDLQIVPVDKRNISLIKEEVHEISRNICYVCNKSYDEFINNFIKYLEHDSRYIADAFKTKGFLSYIKNSGENVFEKVQYIYDDKTELIKIMMRNTGNTHIKPYSLVDFSFTTDLVEYQNIVNDIEKIDKDLVKFDEVNSCYMPNFQEVIIRNCKFLLYPMKWLRLSNDLIMDTPKKYISIYNTVKINGHEQTIRGGEAILSYVKGKLEKQKPYLVLKEY